MEENKNFWYIKFVSQEQEMAGKIFEIKSNKEFYDFLIINLIYPKIICFIKTIKVFVIKSKSITFLWS